MIVRLLAAAGIAAVAYFGGAMLLLLLTVVIRADPPTHPALRNQPSYRKKEAFHWLR